MTPTRFKHLNTSIETALTALCFLGTAALVTNLLGLWP